MTQDQLNERLFQAVHANDIEAVKKAIKDGADVNNTDCNEAFSTPLHEAAHDGYTEIAQVLIENDADVYAEDEIGTKPIDLKDIAALYEAVKKAKEIEKTKNLLKQHGGVK